MKNEYANTSTSDEKVQKEKMEWWIPLGCIILGIVVPVGIIAGYAIGLLAYIILEPIERHQKQKK